MKKNGFLTHVLLLLMLLASGSAAAQHLLHRDYVAEVKARGMTEERAKKAMAGFHRLAFNGHRPKTAQRYATGNQLNGMTAMQAPMLSASDEALQMYGYMPYSATWTEDNYGLYTFFPRPPYTFEKMPDTDNGPVAADGGGCYYDGKYYSVTYAGFMGLVLGELCVYNTETWTLEKYLPVEAGSVSADMDYDPTTGNIYGAFYNDDFDSFVFGYMDPTTGVRTAICPLNRIFFAIAVNSKGEVYGFDEEGGLYIFNKKTGERTKIGDTGILPEYLGGATFYHKTDELYWSVSNSHGSWLYKVDTKTAATEMLCKFPNDEELQGLYIPTPAAEPDAPSKATGLAATFADPALNGTFTFTLPTMTFGGTEMTGALDYDVFINDELYTSGTSQYGDVVNVAIEVPTYGMYKLMVRPKNAVGPAPAAYINRWIGKDTPSAVKNLNAIQGNGKNEVSLTWEPPTETVHGGYLDTNLLYRIQRCCGTDTILIETINRTEYTDVIRNPGTMKPYFYIVTPIIDGKREGVSATSRPVGIGDALALPYIETFDTNSSMNLMTIIDRHNDGKTWEYDATFQAARAQYDWTNAKNEWLITPPLRMTAERVYKLNFDTWARAGYAERIEVKFGKGRNYSDMTETVLMRTTVKNDVPEHYFRLVRIAEDGDYSFGFHALSDVDMWWLYLDNIKLEAGPLLGTPHSVSALNIKAADQGVLSATLSFTAPTLTVDSKTLTAIDGINIYRDGELIKTLTAAPGDAITFTDEDTKQGMNHYKIVALNEKGEGLEVEDSVYTGVDVPKSVKALRLAKVEDKPVISWEAPTEGANGGYIDPAKVVYTVVRSDETIVAKQTSELSVTDNALELGNEQAFIRYYVFSENVAGVDTLQADTTNEVCFGIPFKLPFHESFAGKTIQRGPWTWDIVHGDPWIKVTDVAQYPNASPQDNDKGLVTFQPEEKSDEAILYSANISLDGAQNPKFSFWYYNNPGSFDKLSARIRIDDDPEQVDELAYINMTGTSGAEGWTLCECDLTKYVGHRIQLAFNFTSNSDYYMHLDNITVSGLRDDLPYITDLKGERDGKTMSLTWSEPVDEIGLGFIGYNVYRNGVLLNEEPVVDPMYEDQLPYLFLTYIYQVTVVYEEGETIFSNSINQKGEDVSGIDEIAGEDASATRIYNLAGQRLKGAPKHGIFILGNKKVKM